jgi:hypothetical protein
VRRGFTTIATGDEAYFKLARNLLYSYRLSSSAPYPFSIITDRRNAYTKDFDDVVVLENASSSYLDKLSLLIKCPYDETIFIDADCLAYKDLNQYWAIFDKADDFSCFGASFDVDSDRGWFRKDDIGDFKHAIKFIPNLHGGVYFIRNSDKCKRMYERSLEIARNYQSYKFAMFDEPADEPILALCMALHECHPIEPTSHMLIFRPSVTKLKVDILEGRVSCMKGKSQVRGVMLVHWQSAFTNKPLYKFEADKVNVLYRRRCVQNHGASRKRLTVLQRLLYKGEVKLLYYEAIDYINVTIARCRRVIYRTLAHRG